MLSPKKRNIAVQASQTTHHRQSCTSARHKKVINCNQDSAVLQHALHTWLTRRHTHCVPHAQPSTMTTASRPTERRQYGRLAWVGPAHAQTTGACTRTHAARSPPQHPCFKRRLQPYGTRLAAAGVQLVLDTCATPCCTLLSVPLQAHMQTSHGLLATATLTALGR
jgi:hypothetical protein